MKRLPWVLLLVAALSAGSVAAGLDVDFGATVRVGDDDDLFFSISARYFDADRHAVERAAVHYRDPDDLAVALFVARRSGRSVDRVHELRARGLSWWEISGRLGLAAEVWFVAVDQDPGPPYGNAYGHWKHHKRDRQHAIVLTDADIRNLVAVRVLHEYYGVPVSAAMEWRASGRDLRVLVSSEYKRRHRNQHAAVSHGKGRPGRDKHKHKH